MPWIKCLSGKSGGGSKVTAATNSNNPARTTKKQISVSQPVHLLVKNDFQPQSHVFRTKRLRKPRPCQLCHQAVIKQASCCRVCKYICHKACEDKSARFRDTSQQIHKQWQADPARAFPTVGHQNVVVPVSSTSSTTATNIQTTAATTTANATTTSTPKTTTKSAITKTTTAATASTKNSKDIPSSTVDAISCSPNSTPSPSPSPIDSQTVTHNGSYESQPKNVNNLARNKQVQPSSVTPSRVQRTPGVGADSSSAITANGKHHGQTGPTITTTSSTSGTTTTTAKSNGSARVSEVMELCYVTERIIALWYREDARGVLEHATSLLRSKHADNYMIFNLSSPCRNGEANTRELGWPQGLAPSLERLCSLCKELDSWLNAASNRVVVLHARGSKERLGVAVSAYMNYSSICGGRDQALDRFAMRRFLDDKIGPLDVPSHRRYIEYFGGLLAGSLRISSSPLFLTHLTVLGVPLFEPTGCRAFFKVYEGLTPVYTSDLYSVTNAREFTVNLGGLRLRGDILVKCYHRIYSNQGREVMFSLQFHTCVITENVVSFPRSELDVACSDSRCPPDSVVTLYFANDAKRLDGPIPAPTPAVPHASAHHDPILHWDSYTNLELSDDEGRETPLSSPATASLQTSSPRYTCGPIDGSLYAVVHQHQHQQQQQQQQQHQQNQQSSGQNVGNGSQNGGPNARSSSPLTVSMDSGISSGPPQRPSPPELQDHESQVHGDLDKLLQDMMLTVESYPDPPADDYNSRNTLRNGPNKMFIPDQSPRPYGSQPSSSSTYSTLKDSCRSYGSSTSTVKESSPVYNNSSAYSTLKRPSGMDSVDFKHGESFSPAGNIDYIDEDIPYHARQTSQPFSYGAPGEMMKQHQKLASPSLVRKASLKAVDKAKTAHQQQQQQAPVADLDEILGESSSRSTSRPMSPITPPDPPPEFANGPSSPTVKSPMNNETNNGLSWLKQQQMKLAQRREERSPARLWRQETGNRMIGELRNVQRSRLRHDGYASDSAVLDDDDDIWTSNSSHIPSNGRSTVNSSAPASPLLPQRSLSRKLNSGLVSSNSFQHQNGRPRAESFNNERPFVSVKRAYEIRKQNENHSPPLSGTGSILQKYTNGLTNHHQQQQHQPPRPESRSDSFAKTESFLREHSRMLAGSSLSSHSTIVNNHVAFDEASLVSSSSRYPSRPESRNQNGYFGMCNGGSPKKDLVAEVADVSTNVEQYRHQNLHQQHQQNNSSTDPLVSLIESLSEIRPLVGNGCTITSATCSTTTTTTAAVTNNVNGFDKSNDQMLVLPHEAVRQQQSSSIITVGHNSINTYSTPNQSPKAWQNISTTQSHNDSSSSWTERSVSPTASVQGSIIHGSGASRPQTPAFPVHPRTPYNNASPTVHFASDRPNQHQHHRHHHHHHVTSNHVNHSMTGGSYPNNNNMVHETNNNHYGNYGADRAIFIEERRDVRETGLPPKSPTTQRKDRPVSPLDEIMSHNSYSRGPGTPTHMEYGQSPKGAISYTSINSAGHSSSHLQYYGSRRSSVSTEPQEVADANVKFVRDTSKIWYKPNISREQAIAMLRNAPPGTFVVRDSNSFPGAFGLALKVATPPPGAPASPKDPANELVRHFLIEPTSRGVRLKGCANEPVFSSLSALVYQHSLMAMALPCQLLLPEPEAAARVLDSANNSPQQLLAQGAACNVLYLFTLDTESLTGPQAIKKTITAMFDQKPRPSATIVHFKVSTQGITLTDNARKLFFRRHYPTNNISYCGLDTEERTWDFVNGETGRALSEHRCFGFVARKPAHKSDNQCHIFAELEPEQPATAIVNFVNKVLMSCAHSKANIV